MPLFDPKAKAAIPPEEAVQAVHAFLLKCRDWSDGEIESRLEKTAETRKPEDAASLHAWIAYARFTEHALRELEDGSLDHWFEKP